MSTNQLSEFLHEIAQDATAPELDLWARMEPHLRARQERNARARFPVTRLGWALAAVIVLLSVTTIAYAVDPVINRLIQQMLGLPSTQLFQSLEKSQTSNGVTLTVQQAYADANQVIIGFTIKDANGKRYLPEYRLTDSHGAELVSSIGAGVSGESEILDVKLGPGEEANVSSFDASPIQGKPARVQLRLQITLREFEMGAPDTAPLPSDENTTSVTVEAQTAESPIGKEVGTFTFDLDLPFHAGRTLEPNQKVIASGVEMQLKKVVITSSQVRATLCSPSPEFKTGAPIAQLDPQTANEQSNIAFKAPDAQGCQTLGFAPPPQGAKEWTLTVNELVKYDNAGVGHETRLQGPWVFHFDAR